MYCTVQTLISVSAVRDYVPYSWLSLVQVKREHYAALAHHHSAAGLLAHDLETLSARTKQALQLLHRDTDPRTQLDISEPHDNHERKLLGRSTSSNILKLGDLQMMIGKYFLQKSYVSLNKSDVIISSFRT